MIFSSSFHLLNGRLGEKIETAISTLDDGTSPVTIDDLIGYFSTEEKPVSEKTIRRWIKNNGNFEIKNKEIIAKLDE